MGLYIQSLENLPDDATRKYFVYLLDYGWEGEPLGETMLNNYQRMAALASDADAVVIRGTNRVHFSDEVLSWHQINGQDAENILPAILITNRHPQRFREGANAHTLEQNDGEMKMILIPLKKLCNTVTEVVSLIENLFHDIQNERGLDQFQVQRELRKGLGKAVVDAIIFEPNISGIGFSFNKLAKFFQSR